MTRYRAGSGRWLQPGSQLGKDGGAGSAFAVEGDDTVVVKFLSEPKDEDEHRLKAMLQVGVPTEVSGTSALIAWPNDLVFDEAGHYVGFLMPAAPGPRPMALSNLVPRHERERNVGPNFGWDALLEICARYAAGIAVLHSFPIVVADINLRNVVVSGDLTVTVIDCDSVQLETPKQFFGSSYCQLEFRAPELQGIEELAAHRRDPAADRWSLAVLIWMMLMDGFHPFAGVWTGAGEPSRDKHAAAALSLREALAAHPGLRGTAVESAAAQPAEDVHDRLHRRCAAARSAADGDGMERSARGDEGEAEGM